MENVFKNKKGVGLEIAIVFLLVTFALCAVIMSLAFSISDLGTRFVMDNETRNFYDAIGEKFVACVRRNPTNLTTQMFEDQIKDLRLAENYHVVVYNLGEQVYLLQVVDADARMVVLKVTVCYDAELGDARIMQWSYNP